MKLDEAREAYRQIRAPRSMQADLEARYAARKGSDPLVWSLVAAASAAVLAVAIFIQAPEQTDDGLVAAISPATLGSMISEYPAAPQSLALAFDMSALPAAGMSEIEDFALPTLPDTPNSNWLRPVEVEDENR